MFKKALLVLSLFGSLDFSCTAMFKKGYACKIVSGYLAEVDDVVVIEGTCAAVFGIRDVETLAENESRWNNPPLANYLSICFYGIDKSPCLGLLGAVRGCGGRVADCIKKECRGIFYYGKLAKFNRGVCLHPSWLEKIEQEENNI